MSFRKTCGKKRTGGSESSFYPKAGEIVFTPDGVILGTGERPRYAVELTGRVGRNSKCPCGSGKKFKYCCGHGQAPTGTR